LRQSGEGVKGRCLPWSKEEEGAMTAYILDELDKNIQRTSHFLFFSHWNGYSHFRSVLNWFRNYKKRCFKNQMSVIWSLRQSGEGVKGRCLPWSKEEEGAMTAYIFLMKQVPVLRVENFNARFLHSFKNDVFRRNMKQQSRVHMLLQLEMFSRFRVNQSSFFLLTVACLVEKQQIPIINTY
jgi:hypothetical protein